jgi:hypothetical protein
VHERALRSTKTGSKNHRRTAFRHIALPSKQKAFTRAEDGPFGSVSWAGSLGRMCRRVQKVRPITNRPQVANLPHKCFRISAPVEGFWKV